MDKTMKRMLRSLLAAGALCALSAAHAAHTKPNPTWASPTNHWFLSAGGGLEYPHFNANTRINNGSGFAPPADQDIYSYDNNHHPFVTFAGGYRYRWNQTWFPALMLGLTYQYLLSNDVGGKITQFSDPTFTNYNFRLDVSASILLAAAKLNLFQYRQFLPYVSAGLGGAYVRTGSYGETALPNVTPRTSAGFAENTKNQFAYTLGAGLDYFITPTLIISAGYQYLNLGHLYSGNGTSQWSGQSLNLGSYYSNEVLMNLTYLLP
ncbi:MAG TPA: outer membrane beta-barrel protein [Gammaproteobacteria bacterium]|nr:outer membrane beta-barrel protein [Gammaproteobacteria bacterium]